MEKITTITDGASPVKPSPNFDISQFKENTPLLIGISGVAGVGKSTLAKLLAERLFPHLSTESEREKEISNVMIFPFAGMLKKFATDLGWNGEKDEKGRRLLQLIGTECGRECIHPDIWVWHWLNFCADAWSNEVKAVIADDVRFENEAQAILSRSGYVFKIIGRGGIAGIQDLALHKSETGIPDEMCDIVLDHSTVTISELPAVADKLIEYIRSKSNA